uniref:Transposase IS30-like HTH domain-containing protein n=1 Tax=Bactrocera latifrons TaxID=174628 RepID=A0A0K8U827_BACLA
MPRGKPLTLEERGKIEAYHEEGRSNRDIARRLNRSGCVIDNFIKMGYLYGKKAIRTDIKDRQQDDKGDFQAFSEGKLKRKRDSWRNGLRSRCATRTTNFIKRFNSLLRKKMFQTSTATSA